MMRMLYTMALVSACSRGRAVEANATYAAQLAACVEQAQSRDAGRECLDRIDEAWGLKEGGP